MPSTSLSWLEKAKNADSEAWEYFVAAYSPGIYLKCRREGLNPTDSQDVMQQVFESVYRSIDGFERIKTRSFRSWLFVVTRNKIRDFHRKLSVRPSAAGGSSANRLLAMLPDPNLDDNDDSPDGTLVSPNIQQKLEAVLATFRPRTQVVFDRLVFGGRSVSEVADELAMTHGAVRQAKHSVLRKLRSEFSTDPSNS